MIPGILSQFAETLLLAIHDLTDVCWKKCIGTGGISGGKLKGNEESCIKNCTGRFMDTSYAVLQHLEKLRASQ